MSKAIIVSHAGKGQYTVDIVYDAEYLQRLIDRFNEDYTRLQFTDLVQALAAKNAEQNKIDAAADAVDLAILAYNLSPTEENRAEVERLTIEALQASEAWVTASTEYAFVQSRMDALRRRIKTLRDNQRERKRTALWCIDLADGKKDRKIFSVGDEVGVLEVSGDEGLGQCLMASYVDGVWQYTPARDGRLMNIAGMTHFEVFYNLGIFPAWQKWKHRYRTGVITDGAPDVGWTVELDDLRSSEQNIRINDVQAETRILEGVHATYMSCDDLAFGLKDHVVVDLVISGTGAAVVLDATIIGFVEKPKPCLTSGFGYYALETDGTPQEWQHLSDETGAWTMQKPYATDLTAHAMDGGGEPTIRSWIGEDEDGDAPVLEFLTPSIYLSGKKLADRPAGVSWSILGAALSPKRKFLWAVFCDGPTSDHISVGRLALAVDPAADDDSSKEGQRTVLLSGSAYAEATVNGVISLNSDTLLYCATAAEATASGLLSITPGWEMEEFDLGANAIVGSIGGQFSFNASCTRALSMWDFVHGAKRTPQAEPAPGSTWSPSVSNYSDTWKEKLEIAITAPDAATMSKAGVSLTNSGRQGYLVYNYSSIDQISAYVVGGTITRNVDIAYSWIGNYLIEIGFRDDEEVGIYKQGNGSGVSSETGVNGAGGGTASWTLNEDLGISLTVPLLSVSIPIYTQVSSLSSTANTEINPSDYASGLFTYTYSDINTINTDALLFAVDSLEWSWSGSATYYDSPPDWNSTETERLTEHGYLYCGSPVDASSSFYESTYVDRQPGNFVFVAVPTVPNEDTPGSTFDLTYAYDYTEYNLSMQTPTQPYEKVQGARAAGRKHMAYWQNTRTPGSVREYKAYLTGGDPFTLDDLTGDVIYRAIHPT